MKSYLQYLKDEAAKRDVNLLKAFRLAEIPTSTYYRTIGMKTELRYLTASKVLNAIHEQERRQQAATIAKQLRSDNKNVSRSKARNGVKPISIG
jgi:predicted transcriptional regulator